ncbi:MAG TPA: PQQ-dependent sugar dehydrogenase [Xanthomonadaceae bacterium]|nr:PQQ-dependent sugar dehydrogenase [Xanthomonadaceae bacterium]
MRLLPLLGCLVPFAATAAIPPDLDLDEFAIGFSNPLAVRTDGTTRLYVVERGGRIVVLDADGIFLGEVLDFTDDPPPLGFTVPSSSGDERGLLGLAFHPDFPSDDRMFVYYIDGNSDTVVASYAVTGAPPVAAPDSAQVIVRVDQDFNNHNGGDIHFGPDGYLYIALGDGGSAGDPCNRAQTLNPAALSGNGSCAHDGGGTDPDSRALLGKILRIDVDGTTGAGANGLCGGNPDGSANYAIPAAGNPFADGGTANGCDEVWHYGLRNPYRFSFDMLTGAMYIGDVGQGDWEEVDRADPGAAGLNYGWNLCEGDHPYPPAAGACGVAGTTVPILEYENGSTDNCAVTGGYVYRGPIAGLRGDYVYADYCSGRIFVGAGSGSNWNAVEWRNASYLISGFGEGADGELYLTDFFGGRVLKFVAPDHIFGDGFED